MQGAATSYMTGTEIGGSAKGNDIINASVKGISGDCQTSILVAENRVRNTITGNQYFSGIMLGALNGTSNVTKNKVYDIKNTHTDASLDGINIRSIDDVNVYNNMVPLDPNTYSVCGIMAGGGGSSDLLPTNKFSIYNNTVFIKYTTTGGLGSVNEALTTWNEGCDFECINNILITDVAGATNHALLYFGMPFSYSNASNHNLFYAGTPGPNNLLGYTWGGAARTQTLAQLRADLVSRGSLTCENKSRKEANTPFMNTTQGTMDVHLLNSKTLAASAGKVLAAITDDIDGHSRNNPPAMGADEASGCPITIAGSTNGDVDGCYPTLATAFDALNVNTSPNRKEHNDYHLGQCS